MIKYEYFMLIFIEFSYFEDSSVLRRISCTNVSEEVIASIFRISLLNVFPGTRYSVVYCSSKQIRGIQISQKKNILDTKTTTSLFIYFMIFKDFMSLRFIITQMFTASYCKRDFVFCGIAIYIYVVWQSSRTHCGKSATYLIAEYHRGRLQSTPLGKLCTGASA